MERATMVTRATPSTIVALVEGIVSFPASVFEPKNIAMVIAAAANRAKFQRSMLGTGVKKSLLQIEKTDYQMRSR